jgi:hypothetical protein
MASCSVLDEEMLESPELQAVKNSLKDQNMKVGMHQILKALMSQMPANIEDQLVSKILTHTSLACEAKRKNVTYFTSTE